MLRRILQTAGGNVKLCYLLTLFLTLSLAAPAVQAEDTAPDFNLRSPEGKRIHLKSLLEEGPVLLDFWATWCKPCVKAMPKLQKVYDKYKDQGLTVVGVNEDGPRGQAKVKPFLRSKKLTFPIALDLDSSVANRMRVTAYPTTLLLDQDGMIVYRQAGFTSGQEAKLIAEIEQILGVAETDSE
tara:strand:+ start:448 stop:996 length:549 start_codon:yes stop_codon:yes gene_type:complete